MRYFLCIAVLVGAGVIALVLSRGMWLASEVPVEKAVEASAHFPRTVTDSAGDSLTITSRPARIVSTAPSNTEILFAVGAGPQVVGVTTFCNFPAEASQREKIGGFVAESISTEQIVALKPDLVLTTGGVQRSLTESLRQLGLAVLSYDAETMEDVIRSIRCIGEATGRLEAAETLAASLEQRLERVRQRFAHVPTAKRPRVLLLLSEDPLMTCGPTTFAGQMVELAGGRNLFADVEQKFPTVSEEEIVKRNPAVILMGDRSDLALHIERLGNRPGWNQLDAFRNNRIVAIDENLMYRSGPRLFDGLERLADLLHPPANGGKK